MSGQVLAMLAVLVTLSWGGKLRGSPARSTFSSLWGLAGGFEKGLTKKHLVGVVDRLDSRVTSPLLQPGHHLC